MKAYFYQDQEVDYLYRTKGSNCKIVLDGVEIEIPCKDLQIRYKPDPKKRQATFEKRFGNVARVQRIKLTPCLVCGALPSENAHVTSRSLGGTWRDIVPLCQKHHKELDEKLGLIAFQNKYNLDLKTQATLLVDQYPVQ